MLKVNSELQNAMPSFFATIYRCLLCADKALLCYATRRRVKITSLR